MKSRIVVRKIAPGVSEEGFFGVLDDRLGTKDGAEREKWMTGRYFASGGGKKLSRAYIDFVDAEHAIAFEKVFRGFKFTDERGVSTEVSVEYAPIQQHYPFALAASANERAPTITEDSDFKRFVQELTADPKTRAEGGEGARVGTVEEEINEVPLLAMAYRNKMKKKLSIIRPSEISATSKIKGDKLIVMRKIEGVITEEKKEKRRKKKKETKEEKKARKEKKKAKKERRRQRREAKRKEKAEKKASKTKEETKVKKLEIIKKSQQPQQQQTQQQQQQQQQQPQQKPQQKLLVIKRSEAKEPAKVIKLNVVRKNATPASSSSSSSSTSSTTTAASSSSAKPSSQESAPKEQQPRKLVICRKQK